MLRRVLIVMMLLLVTPVLAQDQEQENEQVIHVVQPGENLFRIALRYGVELNDLATANNITDTSRIFRGQELIIPGLSVPNDAEVVENPLIAGTPITHVVQPGESLTMIAEQYGLTVDQLLQANNIADPNRILRGQELQVWTTESVNQANIEEEATTSADIPENMLEGVAPEDMIVHVVQPGEQLAQIARRYGMNWQALAQFNGITDADRIFVGQTLTIPANGEVEDMGIIAPGAALGAPQPTITEGRQIIVDLSDSRTYAYQDGQLVYSALVSTGLPATPTVQGEFRIYHRLRSQTMSGPGYRLPGVEWVQYFYQGYALHGTYWHNNFGQPMSHGCVNMTNADAEWFYNFGDYGTVVLVQA